MPFATQAVMMGGNVRVGLEDSLFIGRGTLAKSNAASRQAVDAANADYLRAVAAVNLAAAQVNSNQTTLSKATIYSPIDGVVLDRKVSAGQTVVAAMTTPVLFTLASDLSRMELNVDIDEAAGTRVF